MDDNTDGFPAQTASESLDSATSNVSLSSLKTALKSCNVEENFILTSDHGVAILRKEDGGCVPYLLLESVKWNLLSLLEDKHVKLTQQEKVPY